MGQRPPRAEHCGLSDQDEEHGLEGIFGIGVVAQNPPADREHHRPMTPHHRCEGILVTRVEKPFEQFAVALVSARELGEVSKTENARPGGSRCALCCLTIKNCPVEANLIRRTPGMQAPVGG
jgi:hypothetical protein